MGRRRETTKKANQRDVRSAAQRIADHESEKEGLIVALIATIHRYFGGFFPPICKGLRPPQS